VDEVTGLLYIEGQLEAAPAREVVEHLEHCPACRQLLDTLKRESLLLRSSLTEADEPLPARLLAPRLSEGLSWGWLLALGMGAVGLYTFWSLFVSPWIDSLEQSGFGGQYVFTWLVFTGAVWKGWNAMLQFIILISMGLLGAVLLFLFRRSLRRFSSHSLFLTALLLAALAWPQGAHAAEFVKRSRGNYDLPADQTVKSDLYVTAASVRIAGTVEGDLFCFCSSLEIDGHVTGDVFAFSHVVRLTGTVDGSLRTFTGDMTIEGTVQRNVLSFVGSFETTPRSHVAGSATLFVGQMQLDGPLGRDLVAFVGGANLNAPIGGDVWLRQTQQDDEGHMGAYGERGPIRVSSRADVKGSFHYRGPFKPDISEQAHLAGEPQIDLKKSVPSYLRPMSYWYNAMIWGMGFVMGLVLIALAPGFMEESARQAARIGAPLGLGLVAFIVMPVAAILACLTVVGLGVGISLLILWLFFIFFAQVFTAIWIGEAILGSGGGAWAMAGRLALGLFLIRLGALVPILGFWVRFLACVIGIGAIIMFFYHRSQRPAAPLAPVAPTPAAAGD
jgi:hypothetical protein